MSTKSLNSPDGTPITIRPIITEELDRIPMRCWPQDPEIINRLFTEQETIGMAAWKGEKCVGQLHGYRVTLPEGSYICWPDWNNWWEPSGWSADWPDTTGRIRKEFSGAVWCHACIHVGRTMEAFRKEQEAEAAGLEKKSPWGTDSRYFGRGIGTALCAESIRWAREHDYVAVAAPAAPSSMFEFAVLAGFLSWTTYKKLGFEVFGMEGNGEKMPTWAREEDSPEIMAEVKAELNKGRAVRDFCCRVMVLDLR